ncbi:ATP-binding protein [Flavobacterium sp. GSP14]
MRHSFYSILLFVFLVFSCTQKKTGPKTISRSQDSLEAYFSSANNFDLPPRQREKYIEKALEIITLQENDSIYRVNLFKIANRYYNLENWEKYKKTVRLVLEKAEMKRDVFSMAKGNSYLGDYYDSQAIPDSSFLYYDKAQKIYLGLNDSYKLAQTILKKAILQFNQNDLFGSEKGVSKVLQIIKNTNYNDIRYEAYNLLGLIYNELEDYNNAMVFHNKALTSIDESLMASFLQPKATYYNNVGLVYQNKKNFREARKYFEKGLAENDVFKNNPSLYAILLNNLAYSKFKLKQKDGVQDLYFKALKIRDSLQLTRGIITSKINISEYFMSEQDTVKARVFAQQAFELSQKSNNYRAVLNSLKQLSLVQPQNAAAYSKEYIKINDSLQKAERKIGEKFTRIEYETDEIKSENKDLVVQNRNIVYAFSAIGILGLLSFIILTQKAKNRELIFKQQQQYANEEIYNLMLAQQNTIETGRIEEKKRVARELHDGILGRMFGVRMNLDGLNKFPDENAVHQRTNYLSELKNIEQDIREISHDLNREKSELINNFVAIVDQLFEEQKKTYTAKFISNIDSHIKWELVSNALKINVFRMLQESLQNTNKYASATTVKVDLNQLDNHLILKISDDGVGFNVKNTKKGIGLQNIIYRTNECSGVVTIESIKDEGTIITITLPIV